MTAPASVGSPLAGCRVLVTRARKQAGSLTERLEQLGAAVIELPTIVIVPADPAPMDEAIRNLAGYDWIVFTSVNAVETFVGRLEVADPGRGALALANTRIGAIGKSTAACLDDRGYQAEFIPERFVAASVVEGMRARGVSGKRVLLP
ncbi:MAG: uroporphyrinogen-III synthase, partial [Thermomicrobiales bacterium]